LNIKRRFGKKATIEKTSGKEKKQCDPQSETFLKSKQKKKKTKNEFVDHRQSLVVLPRLRPAQLLGRRGRVGREDPVSLGRDKVLDGLLDILHVRPHQRQQQRGRDRGDERDGGMSREEPETTTENVDGKTGRSQVKLAFGVIHK